MTSQFLLSYSVDSDFSRKNTFPCKRITASLVRGKVIVYSTPNSKNKSAFALHATGQIIK